LAAPLAALTDHESRTFGKMAPGDAKVFGSSLLGGDFGDIDLAIASNDTMTMAFLLATAASTRIHPVHIRQTCYEELQDYISWRNLCATSDLRGEMKISALYIDSKTLVFNPKSKTLFPDFHTVMRAAKKLEQRGYTMGTGERWRAEWHLTGDLEALASVCYAATGPALAKRMSDNRAIVAGGFLRDEAQGVAPKDMDIFTHTEQEWNAMCEAMLDLGFEEITFDIPPGKRVNLRKFRAASPLHGHECLVYDVINYDFVSSKEHIVETFDFRHNMVWWDPASHEVRGPTASFGGIQAAMEDIRLKRLVVGDNLWYRAGLARALMRWQRFRREGYTADEANVRKYQEYVKLFQGK
jgi:hypothetical protein